MTDNNIHIPTVEELATSNPNGLLYADGHSLKYLDLVSARNKVLTSNVDDIWAILAHQGEVYYAGPREPLKTLFGKERLSRPDAWSINSIVCYKGRVLHAIQNKVVDTLSNKTLLSTEDSVISCLASDNRNLYGILHPPFTSSLREIVQSDEGYQFGKTIFNHHGNFPLLASIKFFHWKDDIAFLHCEGAKVFYINDKTIDGVHVKGTQRIIRTAILEQQQDELTVLYSGKKLNRIMKAVINLKERTTTAKETMVSGCLDYVLALEVVRDKKLHDKLVGWKNDAR